MQDIEIIAKELSEIERKTIFVLDKDVYKNVENVAKEAKIDNDSARRAFEWLVSKNLVELSIKEYEKIRTTAAGNSSISKGLPERIFIEKLLELGGKAELGELKRKSLLNEPEFNAAMGIAKRNAWISVRREQDKTMIELTGLENELLEGKYYIENALLEIKNGKEANQNILEELIRRGLVEKVKIIEKAIKLNENGERAREIILKTKTRSFDVRAKAPTIYIGKKQPYVQFLLKIRRKLVELGFKEMDAPLITQEFYNFDVLFQPQNHPARSWTDTYQLKKPTAGKLPNYKIVKAVKEAHENGGNSGSRGWGYKWDEEIAKKLMPSAHGTAHSARQLVKGIEVPGKYFAIARCYRPDVMDASHLIEFNQLEGFIVGEELNFRHLLGMLKSFAIEIAGAEKVKFYPDYYPFTEPSVQLSAYNKELGWIEFAGAGIFRPEMMNALGIKETAIAWGLGIDRLAMFALNIKDMRNLFSQDLNWLRNSKMIK
ncbi:MAG: phenylalanine--tRNA ligase subunit alpha [Candidatus Diapherotrites archaeon]|nr:phenylalanine--tRNA ligase subunit alpha [Candidatus Diapherotrites archaeon]